MPYFTECFGNTSLKTHLSHQQEDYYQNWFVFPESCPEAELYTNPQEGSQIAKV